MCLIISKLSSYPFGLCVVDGFILNRATLFLVGIMSKISVTITLLTSRKKVIMRCESLILLYTVEVYRSIT